MEAPLSEANIQELNKFLTYFQSKKISYQKDLDSELEYFMEDQLTDDTTIYNKSDIKRMFKDYNDQIKRTYDKDFSSTSRMAGVYIKLFMQEAQKHDFQFEANMNILEDIRLLEGMKSIELGQGYKQQEQSQLAKTNVFAKKIAQNLPSMLGGPGNNNSDDKKKIEELEAKIKELQSGGSKELLKEIEELKEKVSDMEQEYEGVKTDLDKKLNQSVQVTNLKKMLQQKNTQVKELKQKLEEAEKK